MKITQEDVNTAQRLWRASVPDAYVRLLDAKPADNTADLEKYIAAGVLIYAAGQYFNPAMGTFISFLVIRDALEHVIDTTGVSMTRNTQRLQAGTIDQAQWEHDMQRDIMALTIAAYLAARGGINAMTPGDWTIIAARVATQFGFLAGLAADIAAGRISGAALLSRVSLYAEAGRAAYEAQRTAMQAGAGWEEEIRLLEPGASHCQGCVDQANLEWQEIGTLDPIGDEECGMNCKCTKNYRKFVNGRWIESGEE